MARGIALLLVFLAASAASAQQVTLLDFSIPGCAPCRRMDPVVARLEQEGVAVKRIDGSTSPQVAQRFRVSRYPTLIVMSGKQEHSRITGVASYQTLKRLLGRASVHPGNTRPATQPQTFKPGADSIIQPIAAANPLARPVPPIDIPGAPGAHAPRPQMELQPMMQPRQPAQQPVRPAASAAPSSNGAALLNASVRIKVQDATGHSFGTGTIVDSRRGEALILTCAHLFRDDHGQVMSDPSSVTVELYQAGAGGPQVVERVPVFKILSCNLEADVAFVSIQHSRPVRPARIAADRGVLRKGMAVYSVGCDKGADPSLRSGSLAAIDRYTGTPNLTASGAPVVGRSGGGLFDDKGQVIGVCNAADYESDEGIYASLVAIQQELDGLQLAAIYNDTPDSAIAAARDPGLAPAAAIADLAPLHQPVVRGQGRSPLDGLASLSAQEQAALGELAKRAADSEVVCVIRPKTPGGRSQVLTLDKVSPEFLQALLLMQQEQGAGR